MNYLVDNGGHVVPPDPRCAMPVAGSGVTLTDAATGGDHTETVVNGGLYAFTCRDNKTTDTTFVFGIADATAAANVLWVCVPGETILIRIPDGNVALHYQSVANGGTGYLRRLE